MLRLDAGGPCKGKARGTSKGSAHAKAKRVVSPIEHVFGTCSFGWRFQSADAEWQELWKILGIQPSLVRMWHHSKSPVLGLPLLLPRAFPGCRPSLCCLQQIFAVRGICSAHLFHCNATQLQCCVCACRKRRLLASCIDSAVTVAAYVLSDCPGIGSKTG